MAFRNKVVAEMMNGGCVWKVREEGMQTISMLSEVGTGWDHPTPLQQHSAIIASLKFILNFFLLLLEMLPNLQNNTKCHFLELAAFGKVACCIMHQAVKCASHRKG